MIKQSPSVIVAVLVVTRYRSRSVQLTAGCHGQQPGPCWVDQLCRSLSGIQDHPRLLNKQLRRCGVSPVLSSVPAQSRHTCLLGLPCMYQLCNYSMVVTQGTIGVGRKLVI